MSRAKDSKQKSELGIEASFEYTLEQRMKMVADLIVEKILDDQDINKKIVDILGIGVDNVAEQQ